jgi:hypothetical protein
MKNERIHLRISQVEKNYLQAAADSFGMTISEYVRYCTLVSPPKDKILKCESESGSHVHQKPAK